MQLACWQGGRPNGIPKSCHQEKLAERTLDESAPLHPVTAAYVGFLRSLYGKPFAVLSAAFFAIEYVYNQASGHRDCIYGLTQRGIGLQKARVSVCFDFRVFR